MSELTPDEQEILRGIIARVTSNNLGRDAETLLPIVCQEFDEKVGGEEAVPLYDPLPIEQLIQGHIDRLEGRMV